MRTNLSIDTYVQIREAKASDVEIMAEVCRSNASLYDPIMPGAFKKQAEKFITNGLPQSYSPFIIQRSNEDVGFIGYKDVSEMSRYLIALYLLSDFQRKGIGDKAINEFFKRASDDGINEIILLVHERAHWARQFYEKKGFVIVSREEDYIRAYDSGILRDYYLPNTVLMKRRLL